MKDNTQGRFSPEVLRLFQQIKETDDPEERGELLLQIAHKYADGYDASEGFFTEAFHSVVDEYHRHFLNYNQAGLRLGRVVVKAIEEQPPAEILDATVSEMPVSKTAPN